MNNYKIIFIMLFFMMFTSAFSQNESENAKYNVFNTKEIKLGDKFGLVDLNGKVIIPVKYDLIDQSKFGVRVRIGTKLGFLSYTGKVIVPLNEMIPFCFIHPTPYGVETAFGSKWGLFDYTGKQIIPLKYDHLRATRVGVIVGIKGKDGLLDYSGKEIIPLKYDKLEIDPEGIKVRIGTKFGFFDIKGKEIIPTKYDIIKTTPAGVVVAIYDTGKFKSIDRKMIPIGRYGLFDYTGKEIIPLKYDEILIEYPDVTVKRGNMRWRYDFSKKEDDEIVYERKQRELAAYERELAASRENENSRKYARNALLIGIPLLYLGGSIYLHEYKYRNNRDANWMGSVNAYTASALMYGTIGFGIGVVTGFATAYAANANGLGGAAVVWIGGLVGAAVGIPVGLLVAKENRWSHTVKHNNSRYYMATAAVTIPLFVFAIKF